jgi:hypothetical protein
VRSWTISRRPDTWGLQGDAETQGDDADLGLSSPLFTVVRVTTLDGCSCQYPIYGLPCRMLYLYGLQQLELRVEHFDARWKQRSDAASWPRSMRCCCDALSARRAAQPRCRTAASDFT